MNKLVLALVGSSALALAAVPALAQTASPAPVSDWSGFKAGVQFVTGWDANENDNFTEVTGYPPAFQSADRYHLTGQGGGVNAGYDLQNGPWVYGAMADFSLTDIHGVASATFDTGEGTGFSSLSLRNTWQATVSARAGYAFEKALVYVAGGVAMGDARLGYTIDDSENFDGVIHGGQTKTLVGYTVGGGVDYEFAPRWILGAEGRYVDLGTANFAIPPGLGLDGQSSFKAGFTETEAVVKVQYRF